MHVIAQSSDQLSHLSGHFFSKGLLK
jgi:hypothetical protein